MILHTTPPKSPKKRKNAKQRQLAADWEKLLQKHSSKKVKIPSFRPLQQKPLAHRTTVDIPSLDTGGNATKSKERVYTGDKMIGVATMHKSNSVPVFSKDDAVDVAKMRRG